MALPLRLHHVGFVVANIETAMPGFLRSLAAEWDGQVFHDPLQKVRVAFLTTRVQDPAIELVEPAGDDSPVLRFLRNAEAGSIMCVMKWPIWKQNSLRFVRAVH